MHFGFAPYSVAVATATNLFLVVGSVAATVVAVEGADYLLMMALVVTLIEYVTLDLMLFVVLTVFEKINQMKL